MASSASPVDAPRPLRGTRTPTVVFDNSREVDQYVAGLVAKLIEENLQAGVPTVLGLPTGSTPIGVYRELIRRHREEGLDFSGVITFNLDEYFPMDPNSIHSYRRWMFETFFDHVNIPEGNINIPRGDIPVEDADAFCTEYEEKIESVGGIDLQLLGIGRTGHIGFNEPGSRPSSKTRMVTLDPVTRLDAAADFYGEENVPQRAITMGVGTILAAKQVVMIALGEHKAPIVHRSVEGEVSDAVAASFLQTHRNALIVVDEAAAQELTAVKTPWLVGTVEWDETMTKRGLIWLSQRIGQPILKLAERDLLEQHMYGLVGPERTIESVRNEVFAGLMGTICERPGGDSPQTAIVFSPHPDDDVISMGGTLITLADQGHDVHIAYMTSGNIAVFDHDARRHLDYVSRFLEVFGCETEQTTGLIEGVFSRMAARTPGDPDGEKLLKIKSLIRETEAAAGALTAGVPPENLHFLDLPFYQTGEVTKRPIGDADVQIIAELLRQQNPGQIYVAGDLSDPHGTHRMCAQAILSALDVVQPSGIEPEVWLYRGAWQEYEPHEIERAVPLSPEVMQRKRMAIFKHESQKDRALFPGHDEREFWVRAEERTRGTAADYNALGLPEYFAIEGFVQYRGQL